MALFRGASCVQEYEESASVNDSFSIRITSQMNMSSMSSLSSSSSLSSCSFSSLEEEETSPEEMRRMRQEPYKYNTQPNSPKDVRYFPHNITAYDNCDYLTYDCVSRSDSDSATTYDDDDFLGYQGIFRSDKLYRGGNTDDNMYPLMSLCYAGTEDTELTGCCDNDDIYTESDSECTLEENEKILREMNKTNASILAYNHAMSQLVQNQESEQSLADDTLVEEQVGIAIEGKARACREAVEIATQWNRC